MARFVSAARSDAAKDEYACKLAKAGILGRANKIVTSEAFVHYLGALNGGLEGLEAGTT